MSATLTSLKLSFNGEIRRLSVSTEGLTYNELVEKTLSVFPQLSSIKFSWVDDENDKVVIGSNEELSEALRVMASTNKGYLRFDVQATGSEEASSLTNKKAMKPAATSTTSTSFGTITHVGIVCDQCGVSPLVGARFKCSVRDDYDLCEACEAKAPQQPYPTVKIYHPSQVPAGVMVLVEEGRGTRHGGLFGGGHRHSGVPGPKACHRGVVCNVCNIRNFHGPRFKCTAREDYDLCESCEANDSHEHVMVKIYPQHARMHIQVVPSDAHLKAENALPQLHQILGNIFGGPGRRCGAGHHGPHHRGPHHGPGHRGHGPPAPPGHHGPPPPPHGPGHHGPPSPHGHGHHHPPHHHGPHHHGRHGNEEPKHPRRGGCGRGRGRHCWDRSSIAQAAADRAKLHASAKEEQERVHKAKEDSALEEELLEMCIKESLAEKERMEKEKTESSESSTATSLNSDEKSSSDGQAEEKSERITLKPSAPVQKKLMARFVKDITMPDGSEIAPCSTFFKTWKVRNDGEYDWPEGCVLVSAGGDCMIDPKLGQDFEIRQEVPATPAGGEVELKVELCAPSATGRHVSYFRLQNPEGSYFGQRLWADIRVNEADMSVSMTLAPWEIIEEDDDEEVEVKQPTGKETVEEIMEEEKNPDVLTADEREKILEDTPVVDETTSTSSSQELTESQQLDNEFDEDVRRWSHELRTLASMGFNDLEQLLPVLKAHIKTPSSECDSPKPEGLQAVVLALLSQE